MKNKIITFLFIAYIFIFALFSFILPDKEISSSERRKLNKFPKFEFDSEYIEDVDKYLLDHFPLRDTFRSLKANFNYKILNKLDNNEIYLKDNYIFKSNYPTNKNSIDSFITKTNKLKDLLTKDNNVYMMIIPDKNYYLEDKNFLNIDYDYIYSVMEKEENIDIRTILSLEDYYETDTHWKQEKLDKVVEKLVTSMGHTYKKVDYKYNTYDKFYGVYYGESAINRKPEKLTYLTNETTNNVKVKYLENDKLTSVYNTNKLTGLDAYEVYLDGASSFIEIYNSNNNSGKELVIFRDSFGSSITPLLIDYYSKITVIDNRYITSKYFLEHISFANQDILFLYSTLIVNNSVSLKG